MLMPIMRLCGVWVVTLAIIGCGGRLSSREGSGGIGGQPVDGSMQSTGGSGQPHDGGAAGSTQSADLCPSTPPANGTSCTPPWTPVEWPASGSGSVVAHCSWGDDPRWFCRTLADCVDGTWQPGAVSPELAASCSSPALDPSCPSESDLPVWGTPCSLGTGDASTRNFFSCWYPDLRMCECTDRYNLGAGTTFDPPEWLCWSAPAGCPAALPQAGSPCDLDPGTVCTGWACTNMPLVRCGETTPGAPRVWEWLQDYCPICASPDTPIATPFGDRPIAELQPGDLVFSVDHDGIVAVPLTRVHRTAVRSHRVMRVVLDTGAILEISPGHPTADGRPFSELQGGSRLDPAHTVVAAELVPYEHDATYDILPASSTGTYFAAGTLIGSTLRRPATHRGPSGDGSLWPDAR